MHFPSLSDIHYFHEVVDAGSISRAAERVGLTQPSLTQAMKRLEETLGSTLLIRDRQGARLTVSGKSFLVKSKSLLSQWQQTRVEVQRYETEVLGRFSIGCHPSVGLYTLSKFLPKLLKTHPHLEINLKHDLSRKLTDLVIRCELDYAIVVNPIPHPEFVIRNIADDIVGFWVSEHLLREDGFKVSEQTLLYDPDLVQTQSLIKKAGRKKMDFSRVIPSSSLEVIADLTMSGVGIGILPKRVATKNQDHGLFLLEEKLPVYRDEICLIHRADVLKTRSHQEIVRLVTNSLKSL